MKLPKIRGIIDRRVLVNFRVDPAILARVCPIPFRPQLINGFGIAGVCLIRLKHVRPKGFPAFLALSSENAAHRIAVQWDSNGATHSGVYVPRRDTSSLLNVLAGGRIFPGVQNRARFEVLETESEFHIAVNSDDGVANVAVDSKLSDGLPKDSIFTSIAQCSQFFEGGSLGYSPASSPDQFDGLELQTSNWKVQPLDVSRVQSSFFNDSKIFPEGSVAFDNALLMRGIDHEWHSRDQLCCSPG